MVRLEKDGLVRLEKDGLVRLDKDGFGTSLKRRIGCLKKKTGMAACEELSYDSIGVVTTVGNTVRHVIQKLVVENNLFILVQIWFGHKCNICTTEVYNECDKGRLC